MFHQATRISFSRSLALVAMLSIALIPTSDVHAQACDDGSFLDTSTTWHDQADSPGTSVRLTTDLPSPGLFVAELAVSSDHDVAARLDLARATCGQRLANVAVIERTARRLVLAIVDPGRIVLRAATVDPRDTLGTFQVFSRLVPLNRTEMEEIDPNPAGVQAPPSTLAAMATLNRTEMEEIDPNPAGVQAPAHALTAAKPLNRTEMEEIDPNPAGVQAPPGDLLARLGGCSARAGDDHHDAFVCATPIETGEVATGALFGTWETDSDTFAFTVAFLATVEIHAAADRAIRGALYDDTGRRLGRVDEGSDLSMVERLEPGRYYVRIDAASADAVVYAMTLSTSSW